jgi:hypothetical protein
MKHLIFSTLIVYSLISCSTTAIDEPTRPYVPGDSTENGDNENDSTVIEDLGEELSNSAMRFTSPTLSLYYSTPGTLFMQENDEIKVIDITTGAHASFNTASNSLFINGNEVTLSVADKVKEDDTTTWYRLLTPDAQRIVIVIDRD